MKREKFSQKYGHQKRANRVIHVFFFAIHIYTLLFLKFSLKIEFKYISAM
jgi:hypothetical protein